MQTIEDIMAEVQRDAGPHQADKAVLLAAASIVQSARDELAKHREWASKEIAEQSEAREQWRAQYCLVLDARDKLTAELTEARAAVHTAAGAWIELDRRAQERIAALHAEVDAAREALGEAWLAGGMTLAEGIRRKTAALEASHG